MEFQVLGPLQVSRDGAEVPLRGRQRALLALLLTNGDASVSADRLIDELWGDKPPPSAANMLQGAVSGLRKSFDGDSSVVSRRHGYALEVPSEQVDARRFEGLVSEGERLLRDGDVAGAAEVFRQGLSLWRGPAFADVTRTPALAAEADRLDELRLVATELRIEAELAAGRDGTVVPELESLVGANPYRERLRAELMLALYRSGRQTEALDVYRDGRRRLAEELGLDPGPRLQQLERAILAQDPALEVARPVESPSRTPRRWRRWPAVAAVAAVLATVALAVVLSRGGSPDSTQRSAGVAVEPHSLAVIDPESNVVVGDLPLGGWPRAVTSAGKFVLAARTGDDLVAVVDPASRLVVDTFFATTPLHLAHRDGVVWIANGNSFDGPDPPGGGTIERYDLATRKLVSRRIGPPLEGNADQTIVAAGAEGVWAGSNDSARVHLLDARTGRIVASVPGFIQVSGLAVGGGSVWAADAINDVVFRIDPRRAQVRARIPATAAHRLAFGYGALWAVSERPQSGVWKIDPTRDRAVDHIPVPRRANWVATGAGSVWVTSNTPGHEGPGSLTRIDPGTGKVTATIPLGFSPEGVAVANGLVWVVIGPM
jgi:YVTN family beta-propeller protein